MTPTDAILTTATWTEIVPVDTWMSLYASEVFCVYVGVSPPTADDHGIPVSRANIPDIGGNTVWVKSRDLEARIQVLPQG